MIEELATNFAIITDKAMAAKLHVSVSSLRRKATEMGLKKCSLGPNGFYIWETIRTMFGKHTNKEIAEVVHISDRQVRKICKRMGLTRSKEEISKIRSDAVLKTLSSERRRLIFGMEQKTDRRIGVRKARQKVVELLAKHGYITIKGSMTTYYSSTMNRYEHVESYAISLGFHLELWETD